MPTAFPPKVRAVVYYITAGLGLILGAVQVYFAATTASAPEGFDGLWAVFGFLAGGFGLTAASHVVPNPPPHDEDQPAT